MQDMPVFFVFLVNNAETKYSRNFGELIAKASAISAVAACLDKINKRDTKISFDFTDDGFDDTAGFDGLNNLSGKTLNGIM